MSFIPNIPSAAYSIPGIRGKGQVFGVKRNYDPSLILKCVSEYYKVSIELIKGKSRNRDIVAARHMFCYLSRNMTTLTLKSMGKIIGDRDHTTCIHSYDSIADQLSLPHENKTKEDLQQLSVLISSQHVGRKI